MLFGVKICSNWALQNFMFPPDVDEPKIVITSVFNGEEGETVVFKLDTSEFRYPEMGEIIEQFDTKDMEETKVKHFEMVQKYNMAVENPKILNEEITTKAMKNTYAKDKGFFASLRSLMGSHISRLRKK